MILQPAHLPGRASLELLWPWASLSEPVFVINGEQSSHNLELLAADADLRNRKDQVTDEKLSGRTTHPSFRGCKRRLQLVALSKDVRFGGPQKQGFS